MKQLEIILGTTILVLILLRLYIKYAYSSLLITSLTLVLALIYFFFSFGLLNQIRFRNLVTKDAYRGISILRIIGTVGTGFVLALMTISILFKFQRWPYSSINLLIGLISLLPIITVVVVKFFTHKTKVYRNLLIRLSIISVIGLLVFLTSTETILEMTFRDYPDYIEAVKNEMKDPENLELQQKANDARLEMESSD